MNVPSLFELLEKRIEIFEIQKEKNRKKNQNNRNQ